MSLGQAETTYLATAAECPTPHLPLIGYDDAVSSRGQHRFDPVPRRRLSRRTVDEDELHAARRAN
ncbi:MAG: hypothetical protein QNJ12_23200, partial [Ilumatobacter sp.]|uniref:hypothetical protein n=1 Tax=Ilumatobacter sp. TaxID=1967498 RepID=UPI002607AB24